MRKDRVLVVRNDSWNFTELAHEFTAWLRVEDLENSINAVKAQYADDFTRFPGLANGRSQKAIEFDRLNAFHDRLRKTGDGSQPMSIGATELPISFNEEIFKGDFILLYCLKCCRFSPPELTYLAPFEYDTGEQAYGTFRHCLCGRQIAWHIRGQRKP